MSAGAAVVLVTIERAVLVEAATEMEKAAQMVTLLNGGSDTCFAGVLRETGDDLARTACGITEPYGRSDELDELRESIRAEAGRRVEEWFAPSRRQEAPPAAA